MMLKNRVYKIKRDMILIAGLIVIAMIYFSGLNSTFILDDIWNLEGLDQIEKTFGDLFWHYTFSGSSGPTGRPISLFSFALQFSQWPDDPFQLKAINLLLHLLNGYLVYSVIALVFKLGPPSWRSSAFRYFPLVITLLWVFHPIHVNTVLYLIQRMTLLSATFMLLSIYFYLLSEYYWQAHRHRSKVYFCLAIFIMPTLAVFSKENGALVYVYMLVIRAFIFRSHQLAGEQATEFIPKNLIRLFLIVPTLAIFCYLTLGYFHWYGGYELRDFTLSERLLSQARVLWYYIYALVHAVPSQFSVLGHDSFVPSRGLLAPLSTLLSIFAWLGVVVVSYRYYKRKPTEGVFVLCGIGWFLSGHMLESTTLPLELRFDHRNYLPSIGVLLLVFLAIYKLSQFIFPLRKTLFYVIIFFILIYYGMISKSNVSIWQHPMLMGETAVKEHPSSIRAHQFRLWNVIRNTGNLALFETYYKESASLLGNLGSLELIRLHAYCGIQKDIGDYDQPELLFDTRKQVALAYDYGLLLQLWLYVEQKACRGLTESIWLQILSEMKKQTYDALPPHYYWVMSRYYHNKQDPGQFFLHFDKAILSFQNPVLYSLAAEMSLLQHNFHRAFDYIERAKYFAKMLEKMPDLARRMKDLEAKIYKERNVLVKASQEK